MRFTLFLENSHRFLKLFTLLLGRPKAESGAPHDPSIQVRIMYIMLNRVFVRNLP